MIDGPAGKIGELGARRSDAGLSILIRIADDGIGVGDVKIVANQGDAKRRLEVIQKHGAQLGNAIAIGIAYQRDAIGVLCFGAGEPLHPAGDDILGPVNRRFWTIALDHQYVPVREDVKRARMLKAGRQGMDLQSLRHRGSFILSPSDRLCDPYRRHQILLELGQHGICADLHSRVAAIVVAAGERKRSDGDREKSETTR